MGQYDDRPYEVGKGKPPRHSRWKPGQSGNPRGPTRKANRDVATKEELLADIINQEAEVTLGGRKVRLSKKELILTALVHEAVSGSGIQRMRAFKTLYEVGAFDLRPRDKQPDPEEQQRRIKAVVEELAEEARRLGYYDDDPPVRRPL